MDSRKAHSNGVGNAGVVDPFAALVTRAVRGAITQLIDEGMLGGRERVPRAAYSLAEFGFAMNLSEPTIRKFIARGMPALRVGAQLRIEMGPALEWLRAHGGDHAG